MIDLINQTITTLEQGAKFIADPAIKGAVSGVFSGMVKWLSDKLGNKSAIEKLKLIEKGEYNDETIAGLKANLEYILEDNDELQQQLAKKVKKVNMDMEKAGVNVIHKTNTMNISGNANVNIQDVSGGKITINK